MWGTPAFLPFLYDWGKPVIFGHYERQHPFITKTKMELHTEAWRTGL
jgi:serine/threonine protein phosphatase 1